MKYNMNSNMYRVMHAYIYTTLKLYVICYILNYFCHLEEAEIYWTDVKKSIICLGFCVQLLILSYVR